MFDLYVFATNHSPRVQKKLAIIKAKYPHAKLLVYRTTIYEMIIKARSIAFTPMFWLLDIEAILDDDFDLSWKPAEWDSKYVHVWETSGGKIIEQGLSLWPKSLKLTVDEIKNISYPVKLSETIVTIVPSFDVFVFTNFKNNRIENRFNEICKKYPGATLIESSLGIADTLSKAQQLSTSKMFWLYEIDYTPNFDLVWKPNTWDYHYFHIWTNHDELILDQSLMLWPVDNLIDAAEFEKFNYGDTKIVKQHEQAKVNYDLIVFSEVYNDRIQRRYDNLIQIYPNVKLISDFTSVANLITTAQFIATTKMFWLMNIENDLINEFDLSWTPVMWDTSYVHVWDIDTTRSITTTLSLWPTDIKQDVTDGFSIANLKRMPLTVTNLPGFDLFVTAEINCDYVQRRFAKIKESYTNARLLIGTNIKTIVTIAQTLTSTSMFWLYDIEYIISNLIDLNWRPAIWDQQFVHLWPSSDDHIAMKSLTLWPADCEINLDDDYTVNNVKIMYNNVISLEPYDLFVYSYNKLDDRIQSRFNNIKAIYPDAHLIFISSNIRLSVIEARAVSTTRMFWLLDIEATLNFDLSWRPDAWEQKWIYAWQSTNGKVIDQGLSLWPTVSEYTLDKKITNIKFIDDVATVYQPYDAFFISYFEPNSDQNYAKLKTIVPRIKRIDGIKGIHNAHKKCAEESSTEMFWTIDADTILDSSFDLSYRPPLHDKQYLHLWYTRNPVNDLTYGYGAIKLWPTYAPLSHEGNWLDFTTSVGNIKIIDDVVAVTEFNVSEYDSWRSGFREAIKLCHNITKGDVNESLDRLLIWLNVANDVKFAIDAKIGARLGLDFYIQQGKDKQVLKSINDFGWLKERYKYIKELRTYMPNIIDKSILLTLLELPDV